MDYAILGGLAGVGEAISRQGDASLRWWVTDPLPSPREYRGTFFFRSEDELAMSQLASFRAPVEFHGSVDGQRRKLSVILTAPLPGGGMVLFNGSGEPY